MTRGNSILAIFAVVTAATLGVILALRIPSAVFPEIQFNRAIVMADAGDLPVEQMMVAVTRPLEEAAYGAIGVTQVRSTTTRGSSEIDVTFASNTSPLTSFQMLQATLNEARVQLPAGAEVQSRLLTTGTFPIVDISVASRARDLASLTDIARYDLVPTLHRIPGVYRVEMVGAKYREYVVQLDPIKLLQHKLTPSEVAAGLAHANVIEAAGRVMDAHRMMLAVVSTELHDADQIAALPIASLNGQPVYVRDIASVVEDIREDYIRTSCENGPAVLVGVSRQPDGSTIGISATVHEILKNFRARYPDAKFSLSYDQAGLVAESVKSVRDAIVIGLALAVAVVFGFTMSAASAVIAAIVVPCTIAITFALMAATGMTFNMMTLGGLAAGIGLFIDDAIVVIEAVHRAHAENRDPAAAVSAAIAELGRPLIASTATVVVVFAPLIFLTGVTGVFFRALALTLGGGLLVSLALALYFTPALESLLQSLRRPARASGRIFEGMRSLYVASLKPFMRLPALGLIAALASIGAAYLLYRAVGVDYLPAMDEGAFVLDYTTPPESTLHDTDALVHKITAVLRSTPEVVAYSRRTGTQLGFFLTESNRGDMSVRLTSHRSRGINAIIDSVRARILATVPGVRVEFSQVLQDLIGDLSGTPEPVEVKVFGADQVSIEATARKIADLIRPLPGIVDVFNGLTESLPEQEILVDEAAAERYGLNPNDIQTQLRAAVQGTVATYLRVGDQLRGVRVRYPDEYHTDLAALSRIMLQTPGGGRAPLSNLVTTRWLGKSVELDRERLRPVVHVTARVEGIDLGTAIGEVKARLRGLTLPAGVTLEYGGLYAQQRKAFHQLSLVLLAGVIATFIILLWEFARFAPAVAVLAGAASCLVGSFAALMLAGVTLNISSFMGLIMVIGISAKNGILLLDHAEHDLTAGVDPRTALVTAARMRLRPILMTTLATIAGLTPLALGLGAGAKIQQPLALAVIGGLTVSLLLATPVAVGVFLMSHPQAWEAPNGDRSIDG
jgi:CzcA family heavy metal efflux pump